MEHLAVHNYYFTSNWFVLQIVYTAIRSWFVFRSIKLFHVLGVFIKLDCLKGKERGEGCECDFRIIWVGGTDHVHD